MLPRSGPKADLTAFVEEHAAADLLPTVARDVVLFESNQQPKGPAYAAIWRGPPNLGGRREA
jgi:hypothetical protein